MARKGGMAYLSSLIIFATTCTIVSALTLNQGTTKPRHTKFSGSTTEGVGPLVTPVSSSASKDDSGVAYYRLFNSKTGATCILLKTDAVVEVQFKLHDLDEKADSFIPEKALIEGDCKDEDAAFMRISWTGYSLVINFAKTPGGERWYISSLGLNISPDLPQFHGIPIQRKSSIKLYHRKMLIPTPVGKSYSCSEVEVSLETDEEDNPPPGIHGILFLRLLQVQPFMYKSEDFETAFECKPQRSFRDETAPIAVGSTLAIAVLVTISGYGAYRYFKVKNVQYNTME
ncbi:uncharacterized protein LOC126892907 [Diabrotica virgifera virgifera]|uniref:Lysosome-associated membrane glycoprotein 5 n=2 Tax=Diabrotica virgifera virgifera TaxID=50390 RepID=A0ABM5L8F1_DIAVI|nr:uncharacterized protein LOC126892907 [Diabrotica virgifera virgifera]